MATIPTPGCISIILANPSPDSTTSVAPEIVVQIVDLKPTGNIFTFSASDGKLKLRAILQSIYSSEVNLGNIQNLGLLRIIHYTLNDISSKNEKYLLVTKCEVAAPPLETEFKTEVKNEGEHLNLMIKQENRSMSEKREGSSMMIKPKHEFLAKSASQIVHEQHGNMAPAARMAMTRRVMPLVSLNPYQGNWTIKVRVTSKGNLRAFKNARGEGHVLSVELTDEEGTQIQATMFGEAAKKYHEKFEMGKVYYISKGSLKVANKQFRTVKNDYELTLNEYSSVEEASQEAVFISETKFNFVPIDMLGPYVNGKELVDIIGVVQSVSPTMSIRRKSDNESIPKRDITIADETKKTVVVSLWNDLATNLGQELLEIVDESPIVAIKSLKVGDFQGISLSTVSRSTVVINPDTPESVKLRSWYDSEGKGVSMASIANGMSPSSTSGARSMYNDRVTLSCVTENQTLGEDKFIFFLPACVFQHQSIYKSLIKPDQNMWYRGCRTCNKKVTNAIGSGYWCEGCQKNDEQCSLRYIMSARVSDPSGEAWISIFNEQAQQIIGCSADELDNLKSQEENSYQLKLKEATWTPQLLRISVSQNEYMNEKRQRITARSITPFDFAAESRYLLEEISKKKVST